MVVSSNHGNRGDIYGYIYRKSKMQKTSSCESRILHLSSAAGTHTSTHKTQLVVHAAMKPEPKHTVARHDHGSVSPMSSCSKIAPLCTLKAVLRTWCPLTFGSCWDLHSLYSVCLILPLLLLLRHTSTKEEERRERREASSNLHPPLGLTI